MAKVVGLIYRTELPRAVASCLQRAGTAAAVTAARNANISTTLETHACPAQGACCKCNPTKEVKPSEGFNLVCLTWRVAVVVVNFTLLAEIQLPHFVCFVCTCACVWVFVSRFLFFLVLLLVGVLRYDRSTMSTSKAGILKAVGSQNEAQATTLLADLDTGLGKRGAFSY